MAKKVLPKTKSKPQPRAQKKAEVAKAQVTKLSPKQEMFCRFYTTDREFFGNGVRSYIEAYNPNMDRPGAYNTARARASYLLSNVNILARIDELMEVVINDAHVDKQMAFWIQQKASPQTSISAIKEYNALHQRVVKKIDAKLSGDLSMTLVEFVGDDDEANEQKEASNT